MDYSGAQSNRCVTHNKDGNDKSGKGFESFTFRFSWISVDVLVEPAIRLKCTANVHCKTRLYMVLVLVPGKDARYTSLSCKRAADSRK